MTNPSDVLLREPLTSLSCGSHGIRVSGAGAALVLGPSSRDAATAWNRLRVDTNRAKGDRRLARRIAAILYFVPGLGFAISTLLLISKRAVSCR